MATNERAKATVDVDGQAAEQQLNEIADAANKARNELVEMGKSDKFDPQAYNKKKQQVKELDKQYKKLNRTTIDVNRVMKNLNKTSFNDLIKAEREIRKEMKKVGGQTKQEIK